MTIIMYNCVCMCHLVSVMYFVHSSLSYSRIIILLFYLLITKSDRAGQGGTFHYFGGPIQGPATSCKESSYVC